MSYDDLHWMALTMRLQALRMRGITWSMRRTDLLHTWNMWRDLSIHFTTFMAPW